MTLNDTHARCIVTRSRNISTVAYEAIPGFVFVRVPDERGRYILTDRCVAERACPSCKSVVGEPCRSYKLYGGLYVAGVHYNRREVGHPRRRQPKPKLRIRADDLDAARAEPDPDYVPPAPVHLPRVLVLPKCDFINISVAAAALELPVDQIAYLIAKGDLEWINGKISTNSISAYNERTGRSHG